VLSRAKPSGMEKPAPRRRGAPRGPRESKAEEINEVLDSRQFMDSKDPEWVCAELRQLQAAGGLGSYEIDELLGFSDLTFSARDHELSRSILEFAASRGEKLEIVYHKMSRLDFAVNDFAAAAESLHKAVNADPQFPFNWLWLANAYQARGDYNTAAEYADRFVKFDILPYSEDDFSVINRLADQIFSAGDRTISLRLYEYVNRHRDDSPLVPQRIAESYVARREWRQALRFLLPLYASGRLVPGGWCALSQCFSAIGNHQLAIQLGEELLRSHEGNTYFVRTYFENLLAAGEYERALARLEPFKAKLPTAIISELVARTLLESGDIQGSADLVLAEFGKKSGALHHRLLTTIARRALDTGSFSLAEQIADTLYAASPDDLHAGLLRLDVLFRMQRWEECGAIVTALGKSNPDIPAVAIKQFEYACFTGDRETAARLFLTLDAAPYPSKEFALPLLRYLAERQAWPEVLDRALTWIDNSFKWRQIGYVLYRAAKRTGREEELVQRIETITGWRENAELRKLWAALRWNRLEAHGSPSWFDPASDNVIAEKLKIRRSIWLRCHKTAVFLCTDANYLGASIVALHSAIGAIPPDAADYFLVVDNTAYGLAQNLAARFHSDLRNVQVVSAEEIVGSAAKLYPQYGIFTSGNALAASAYYRIFFAKYLQQQGKYPRGLYIDSDLIVTKPILDLLHADIGDAPLGARLEPLRPEVRRAIRLHGIRDNRYFNSGVLLFDFLNNRLGDCLDRAIGAIEDDNVTLIFHDQCALNIGLRGDFAELPIEFNYPVFESDAMSGIDESARVLHFLERPKPWSPAYFGECSILWHEHWRKTADYIGEREALDMMTFSE
jgi:lipopolysaccharide biosynthesis glycosyltransferase/uncharacterized protein HemY